MAIGFVLITTNPGDEEKVRTALDSIEHVTARWMSVSYTHLTLPTSDLV